MSSEEAAPGDHSVVQDELIALLPQLRAFARALCGDLTRADDLVQEAIVKAWSNLDKFEQGSNLRAWVFTILRNHYYSEIRKRRREVEDVDDLHAASLSQLPNQLDRVILKEFTAAIAQLPSNQREALVLTGAAGFSCAEAAAICDCAPGTIKSRVSRARARIMQVLDVDELDADQSSLLMQAAQNADKTPVAA